MTVYDLNRDQLQELKQQYYAEKTGKILSYEELAFIDDYVSDAEVYDYYNGTAFTPDDFFCSAGEDEDDDARFVIMDTNGRSTYFLHEVSSIEYQWSDWAASTFSKYGAQGALSWARKNGYTNAKAIIIL